MHEEILTDSFLPKAFKNCQLKRQPKANGFSDCKHLLVSFGVGRRQKEGFRFSSWSGSHVGCSETNDERTACYFVRSLGNNYISLWILQK